MLTLFVAAFGLGLLFNVAPGAVFAETLRHGVQGGFRPALAVQIGSLVGDALWAVLGLLGIGLLLQLDALRQPLAVAGALYLLWLAWDSWQAAATTQPPQLDGQQCHKRALRSGMLLSITNPQNVAYWAALGSALAAVGISAPQPLDYTIFFAGFMASSVLWAFVCALLIDRLFAGVGWRWARLTYRLCALAFALLAVATLQPLLASVSG